MSKNIAYYCFNNQILAYIKTNQVVISAKHLAAEAHHFKEFKQIVFHDEANDAIPTNLQNDLFKSCHHRCTIRCAIYDKWGYEKIPTSVLKSKLIFECLGLKFPFIFMDKTPDFLTFFDQETYDRFHSLTNLCPLVEHFVSQHSKMFQQKIGDETLLRMELHEIETNAFRLVLYGKLCWDAHSPYNYIWFPDFYIYNGNNVSGGADEDFFLMGTRRDFLFTHNLDVNHNGPLENTYYLYDDEYHLTLTVSEEGKQIHII